MKTQPNINSSNNNTHKQRGGILQFSARKWPTQDSIARWRRDRDFAGSTNIFGEAAARNRYRLRDCDGESQLHPATQPDQSAANPGQSGLAVHEQPDYSG